jgi:magnesium transporter
VLQTVYQSAAPSFVWLDLVEPTRGDLEQIARQYGLPGTAVQDCLDPEHLPKFERFDGTSFTILRAYDERCDGEADTVQALTRKVAMFWSGTYLLTIHRKEQPYLSAVMVAWRERTHGAEDAAGLATELLADIANAVVLSYEAPLVNAEARIDAFESQLLRDHDEGETLREMYRIKRRVTLAKRLLWRTLSMTTRLVMPGVRQGSLLQDLRENAESMHFYADELLEDVTNLLNMQLALAARRTNEVVQVLTIFSAFFLPLTFIVGVYGMNFEHMPELPRPWGYPAVWLVMIAVSTSIWVWFRRRGWMS